MAQLVRQFISGQWYRAELYQLKSCSIHNFFISTVHLELYEVIRLFCLCLLNPLTIYGCPRRRNNKVECLPP